MMDKGDEVAILQQVESLLAPTHAVEFDQLVARCYSDLRRLAHGLLQTDGRGQATTVLHDVLERLLRSVREKSLTVEGEEHLFALVSRNLRRVLVDRARREMAEKRGGGAPKVPFDPGRDWIPSNARTFDLIALHEALENLRADSQREYILTEMRFFGGYSQEEAAQFLGVSIATVERDWRLCKAKLQGMLSDGT